MSDAVYTIGSIQEALTPVFSQYGIKSARLFGSYAKGSATSKSDVDLLVDSGLKGLRFVGLIEAIHNALDKYVDVFDVEHINAGSLIQNEIDHSGVTIYEK